MKTKYFSFYYRYSTAVSSQQSSEKERYETAKKWITYDPSFQLFMFRSIAKRRKHKDSSSNSK